MGGGGEEGAPSAKLPSTVVFQKVELRDSGMDNMVSHTLLVPKGWQVQGGQQWTPQAYRDAVHLNLRVSAGDGRELAVYPGAFYEDSNAYEVAAQMGAQNARLRPAAQGETLGVLAIEVARFDGDGAQNALATTGNLFNGRLVGYY